MQVTNATQSQIEKYVCLHKETIGTFNLCNLVERTTIKQINAAVDYECLADLINNETGILIGTMPDIPAPLFKMHVDITAKTLAANKSTVESTTYNYTKPLATIFHATNEYSTMDEASGAPTNPSNSLISA